MCCSGSISTAVKGQLGGPQGKLQGCGPALSLTFLTEHAAGGLAGPKVRQESKLGGVLLHGMSYVQRREDG